jgi:hypothetical protein
MMMIAELNAIQPQSLTEVQSITKDAIQKSEAHLDKAKKLTKKLQDDSEESSDSNSQYDLVESTNGYEPDREKIQGSARRGFDRGVFFVVLRFTHSL